MKHRILILAALTVLLTAGSVFAHQHKVLGTVKVAASDQLTMETTDGNTVTVKITATTKVVRDKEEVKADTLKPGTRVVVTTESHEDPYTAQLIQVGAGPGSPEKPKK
jgi:hypothetical protein